MGYDMRTIQGKTEEEELRSRQAREAADQAIAERNALDRMSPEYAEVQKHVSDLLDVWYATDVTYFRYNVWNMGRCCRTMDSFGMLKEDRGEKLAWPEPPTELGSEEYLDHYYESLRDDYPSWDDVIKQDPELDKVEGLKEYHERTWEILSRHCPDEPGINYVKFTSNDGWVVTPGEAKSAADLYHRTPEERKMEVFAGMATSDNSAQDWRDWFERWVKWLEFSATRGGFRVW